MKKLIGMAFILALLCTSVFAEGFTVRKTVGKVNYESSSGVWKKLIEGDKITSTTVIDVGLQSSIELVDDNGKVYSVKAMKKGSLETLLEKTTGLKKAFTPVASSVGKDSGTSSSVSTASSRASEAKSDLDWDE